MDEQENETQSYSCTPDTKRTVYQSLPGRLRDVAKLVPDREAIVLLSKNGDRTAIKYQELYVKSKHFAKGLAELGIRPSDVVGISGKNSVEFVFSLIGVQMVGAQPLLFTFQRNDGSDVCELLHGIPNCTALILDQGQNDDNIRICENLFRNITPNGSISSEDFPNIRKIILLQQANTLSGYTTVTQVVGLGKPSNHVLPVLSPDDIAVIFLTSGTTSIPKAVPHTHHFLLHVAMTVENIFQFQPGDRFYNDRPFRWFGGFPLIHLSNMITIITAVDIMDLKTIEEINNFTAKGIEKENCTFAVLLTSSLHDMVKIKIPPCTKWPLKCILTGGLPVGGACSDAVGKLAKTLIVAYGSTEVGFVSSISLTTPEEFEEYSVGYPVPGIEMKIVDDDERIVPKGTVGEMYVRGRHRFQGYINSESDPCSGKTGWYKTDDIGMMKGNGNFIVTGRKSDMMIIGGLKVSTTYLENLLKSHPQVVEAFVQPIQDDKMFQRACAAIVTTNIGSVNEEDLKFHILQKKPETDSFWDEMYIPKHFVFLSKLPCTDTGKLNRKECALTIKSILTSRAEYKHM